MTTALAGYLAIGQIAQHLDLTLPDDIAAGEPVTLGDPIGPPRRTLSP
jgi:hypothetical protein